MLQGHPDMKKIPGIDATTGSLGNGMSFALGIAAAMHLGHKTGKVYCLLGDGEAQEGIVWEARRTPVPRSSTTSLPYSTTTTSRAAAFWMTS